MAWIGGNPAVIGGDSMNKEIASVEVLIAGKWVEVSSINVPRVSHSSANTSQAVLTMGGLCKNGYLDSIEKYQNNTWSIINLRLPIPCCGIGICSLENNLLLFGGKNNFENSGVISRDTAIYIDTESLLIAKLKPLQEPLGFYYNSLVVVNSELISIFGIDSAVSPKLATYSIKSIMI